MLRRIPSFCLVCLGAALLFLFCGSVEAQIRRPGVGGPRMGGAPAPGAAGNGGQGAAWENRAVMIPSRYYLFRTDLEKTDAEHLSNHMDAVFTSYMTIFSKLPIQVKLPSRLNLYLFADQQSYRGYLGWKFGDDGTGSWGKCIRLGQNYWVVGWKGDHSLDQMQSLLQHEGFHQVAGQIFPDLPLWANEGLAELFERGIVVGDRLALGEISNHDYRQLQAAIEQDALVPFDRFFSMSDSEWGAQVRSGHAQVNYLQAWSMVHFLLYAENGKYEQGFMKFLVQLNRKVGWEQAFVGAFGMPDFRAMEREWLEYIKKEIPTDYRTTVRRLDFLAAGTAKLAEEKKYPASLEELKEELGKINFEHESDLYGEKQTLTAGDADAFTVPGAKDDPTRRFVLVDRRNRPLKPDSKRRPTQPPKILAVGRMPRSFEATVARRGREFRSVLASGAPRLIEPADNAKVRKESSSAAEAKRPVPSKVADSPQKTDDGFRTWHSADGRFSVEARLTSVLGDRVHLKKRDGTTIKVPREKLSDEDKEFLKQRK